MLYNRLFGQGVGINSIPVRFALLALVMTAFATTAVHRWLPHTLDFASFSAFALIVATPAGINYLAANKLAGMIRALRKSTQALVSGNFNEPVDIDCACEVGGLADSFRAMATRLNSNILRMNVLAYSDAITGLPNRAVISHIFSLAQQREPEACAATIMFIDLDGFKRVNDTLGHDAGDELLRQVADRIIRKGLQLSPQDLDACTTAFGELCQSCPTRPVFARFAGDEFLLLLPGHHDHAALADLAERIRLAFAECFTVFNNEVFVSASMGIARMPEDASDPDALLAYADIAMYQAKDNGKNRHVFFDSSLKSKVEERALIERELHHAIDHDALTLHFQPKFDANSMQLTGVEALARWNCPGIGPVAPEVFVAIAEQCGLMVPLGATILRLALRQAHDWMEAGRPIRVAVNVSPVQFERPGFVELVIETLGRYAIPATLLELEITESTAMADFARSRERINTLRRAGIIISIDDFGIGYSNLSQLARLEYDALKIDRSLVASINEHDKTESMLAAIIAVSKALGHTVIAEGIEKPEQMSYLRDKGCSEFQGFLFARPMPAMELDAWLDARGVDTARVIPSRSNLRVVGR